MIYLETISRMQFCFSFARFTKSGMLKLDKGAAEIKTDVESHSTLERKGLITMKPYGR